MSALDFSALYREERARLRRPASASRPLAPLAPIPGRAALLEVEAARGGGGARAAPVASFLAEDSLVTCLEIEADRPAPVALDGAPATIAYCGEFVSEEEERALVEAAERAEGDWVSVRGRRLRRLGGPAGEAGFVAEPLPMWAAQLCAVVGAATVDVAYPNKNRTPNHVLANAYDFDDEAKPYVFPHTDGPAYDDRTFTLSCGADCLVTFARRLAPDEVGVVSPDPVCSVYLRRRSLLVFSGDAYTAHTHAIDAAAADTIDDTCANAALASVEPGDVLDRRGLRHSFTLRRALAAPSVDPSAAN